MTARALSAALTTGGRESTVFPVRFVTNSGSGSRSANVLILFPSSNQYVELTEEEARAVYAAFSTFIADLDKQRAR
jgi:hypothetical protein